MALQADRPLKVFTPLGADVMLADGFSGEEAISVPFEYNVRMLSEDDAISASSLLRKPVHLSVVLADGSEKFIHGLVSRFVSTGRRQTYASYEATLVPWLWFLSLTKDCKIFQNKTVPEIVEQVFKDNGYTDYQLKLYKSYPQREYCVQYRESSFDFVSRLLEEEGIFYFFEHSESKHTLILADSPPAIQPCPGASSFRVMPDPGMSLDDDVITDLTGEQRVSTGKITLRDYNFETPASDLTATFTGDEPNEIYDYPGKYADRGGGDRYARLRLEEREMPITDHHRHEQLPADDIRLQVRCERALSP